MAQLTFDKYTITGTAQELADYVSAYEERQVKVVITQDAPQVASISTTDNPSGM